MGEGIRIFSDDFANNNKGGTSTASSNTGFSEFAFDNIKWTKWYSVGEDTDGDEAYIEREFTASLSLDVFYAWKTNITDGVFQYWNGSIWVDITSGIATLLQKNNGNNYYYVAILDSPIDTTKIRFKGEDTSPANLEKDIVLFHAFQNIGQFEFRPTLTPDFEPSQIKTTLINAKRFIFNQGEAFVGTLIFNNHFNQNDIDLYQTIVELKQPFYIWKSGGDEAQFTYLHEGHRFEDIYKVSIFGKRSPRLLDNRYNLALNVSLRLEEVA